MYHCLAISSCDCPHYNPTIVPGGGLYKMVSTSLSKFFWWFITVPIVDAVRCDLLSCCQRLLWDGHWSIVAPMNLAACCTVTCRDFKQTFLIGISWNNCYWPIIFISRSWCDMISFFYSGFLVCIWRFPLGVTFMFLFMMIWKCFNNCWTGTDASKWFQFILVLKSWIR